MEFLDDHEDALIHSAWHAIANEETSTPYLFKFCCNEDNASCCFLMTDTKSVWVEVMGWNRIGRRALHLEIVDDFAGPADLDETLQHLVKLHSFASAESLTPGFLPMFLGDLRITLSNDDFSWEWHLEALPRAHAADLLSKQLIMPMLNWSGYVMDSYMDAISTEHEIRQLERDLDASGRTAKRHPDKMVQSVMRQSLFTTALRRLTETGSGSATRSAIFRSPEDEPQPRPRSSSPPPPSVRPSARSDAGPSNRQTSDRLTSIKQESLVPKVEPSPSPAPNGHSAKASGKASNPRVKKEEEEEEEGHAGSETELEPEEEDDEPRRPEEEGDKGEGAEPVKDEDDDEDDYLPRRKNVKEEDIEEEGEEAAYASTPAQSTRASRKKPKLASPSRSPQPRSRKRKQRAADDDDVDMGMMKKEESEEEKPVVKKETFVPKSRLHVKRSKY